ncbi:MAG: glycosyltransferase family 2 protein [Acidobacteriota bacterium]
MTARQSSAPCSPGASDRPSTAVPITALVTTHDEEHNIDACLASLAWVDEILVVDSFSSDGTCEAASRHTDRILQHPYESPARQKNWGMSQARHPWILILDADERVTPELEAEVRELMAAGPGCVAYWIPRRNTFLGRVMHHGGWESDRVIRLVAKDRCRYPDVRVHEEMQADGPVGALAGKLDHHSMRSYAQYAPKMDRYSRWWAKERWERGRRTGPLSVFGHTVGRFIRMFVLKRGFLDGGHGLMLALLAAFSVYQKHAKLWEMGLSARRSS